MSSTIYKKTCLVDSGGQPNFTDASQDYGDPRHENLFDAQSEEPGGPEGARQARIELARLDGVDGLPGHIKGVGQLGLRPVALGAQRRNRELSYQGPTPPCRRRISLCIRLPPILTHRIPASQCDGRCAPAGRGFHPRRPISSALDHPDFTTAGFALARTDWKFGNSIPSSQKFSFKLIQAHSSSASEGRPLLSSLIMEFRFPSQFGHVHRVIGCQMPPQCSCRLFDQASFASLMMFP